MQLASANIFRAFAPGKFGAASSISSWRNSRRRLLATLVLTALPLGAASAQEWPARTIRAIVPLTAGSATVPVIPLGNIPTVLVVSASKGYKSLADFVAAAKAKPGAMNYSSAGAGNFSHFATEVFRRAAGFEAVHVPNKGAPEALTEVLTERVDFFFSPLILALPFIKEGKLQALAVSGSQRALALPHVPTTVESGYPDSEYNFWVGMFAPARVPSAILDALYRQSAAAVQNASVRERLAKLGVDPMILSATAFQKLVREEVATNTRIAAAVGIKAN